MAWPWLKNTTQLTVGSPLLPQTCMLKTAFGGLREVVLSKAKLPCHSFDSLVIKFFQNGFKIQQILLYFCSEYVKFKIKFVIKSEWKILIKLLKHQSAYYIIWGYSAKIPWTTLLKKPHRKLYAEQFNHTNSLYA